MKKLHFFFLIMLLTSLLIGCSNKDNTTDKDNIASDIKTDESLITKKIRIGTTDYAPFIVSENGSVKGPFVDIVSEALDNLGYEYEFVNLPWSRLLDDIKTGEVDMALPFYDNPERRQFLHYAEEPIGLSQINAIVQSGSEITFDGTIASLSEYNIGTVQDYFYTREFEHAVNENMITPDEAITSDKNIEKILQERIDLIFEDFSIVKEYLKKNDIEQELKFLEPPLTYSYLYIVFSKTKNLTEVRQGIDSQLKIMKSDSSLNNTFADYDLMYYGDLFKLRELTNPPQERFFQSESNSPLTVGILGNTEPYAYYENNELTGFGVDFITEVLTRIGVDFELVDLPFSRMLEELKSGTLDIGTDLYLKPERQEYVEYPRLPYAGYPSVLFKKSDLELDFTGNLEALIPYTIGYVRDYSIGPFDKYKNTDKYDFSVADSPENNIESLANERVDLIIEVKSTGESLIEKMNLSDDIVPVDPPLFYDYSYVVFSKKNNLGKLVSEYDLTVQSMFDDGTIEALSTKYNLPYLEFDEFR